MKIAEQIIDKLVISENAAEIQKLNLKLKELRKKQIECQNRSDWDTYDKLNDQIIKVGDKLDKLKKKR